MNTSNTTSTGLALYQAIWKLVGETFFDESRLVDWHTWEHRFDDTIVSDNDALAYADQMLASLKDPYTERLQPVTPMSAIDSLTTASQSVNEIPQNVQGILRPDGIAYLRISSFDDADISEQVNEAVEKIAHCDGIILDLRQNSGGRMHQALDCCGFFITNGMLTTIESRVTNNFKARKYLLTATSFFATELLVDGTEVDAGGYPRRPALLAGKPLAIIINGRTASAGELMVGALVQNGQPGRVCLIGGDRTPGKGIGQAEYEVLGKTKLRITRCRWLCPSGDWLGDCGQTISNGIEPEIFVEKVNSLEAFKVAVLTIRAMLEQSTAA